MYQYDYEFAQIFNSCMKFRTNGYVRNNGYLFKEKRLCVPKCSIRGLLVREAHEGRLMGHFEFQKTFDTLHEHFYWPHVKGGDVQKFCENCITCKKAKPKVNPHGL